MVNLNSLNPFAPTVKATTEISQLRIYPIKSCRGITLASSYLTRKGLDLDRNWMFVDTTTMNFVTIRQISELTLVDTALASSTNPNGNGSEDDLELVLSIRGKPELNVRVPARPSKDWLKQNTELKEVEIWETKTDGFVYNDAVNKLFTEHLKKPVALVYKGPTPRLASGNGSKAELGREEHVNFPDVLPVQIANEASIKELNSRLRERGEDEITIERFRPNIVVKGDDGLVGPWSEDKWKTVRVVNGPASSGMLNMGPSTLDIDVCCHCARCQVPNVDPETAVKHKKQPWDTLMSYRRIDEGIKFKPCFGMLCCPRNEGEIRVGMRFEVTEETENHVYKKGF